MSFVSCGETFDSGNRRNVTDQLVGTSTVTTLDVTDATIDFLQVTDEIVGTSTVTLADITTALVDNATISYLQVTDTVGTSAVCT